MRRAWGKGCWGEFQFLEEWGLTIVSHAKFCRAGTLAEGMLTIDSWYNGCSWSIKKNFQVLDAEV